MVSTISRPVHAALVPHCGCYRKGTSHRLLPQASHVLICLAGALCLFPCSLVLTVNHLFKICLPAGKFNKHVDAWDSNQDNKFFSFEGFMFVQQQIWNFSKSSDLATPEFCILKKYKKYEIRR